MTSCLGNGLVVEKALGRINERLGSFFVLLLRFLRRIIHRRNRARYLLAAPPLPSTPAVVAVQTVDAAPASKPIPNPDPPICWGTLNRDLASKIILLLHSDSDSQSISQLRLVNKHWWTSTNSSINSLTLNTPPLHANPILITSTISQLFLNLSFLDLMGIGETLTDTALEKISVLTKLEKLNLSRCKGITEKGLGGLGRLEKLRWLEMRGCVKVEGLGGVRGLVRLGYLDLAHCDSLVDGGLENLGELRSLTFFSAYRCRKLSNDALHHIASLPCLTSLDVGGCPNITHEGMPIILTIPQLTSLSLRNDPLEPKIDPIGDDGLLHLQHLRSLKNIDLCFRNKITNFGLGYMANLTNLQEVHLAKCTRISDDGLRLLTTLSGLTSLNMWGCSKITDSSLEAITVLKCLTHIDLSQCTRVTDRGVPKLRGLPGLAHLNLEHCRRITANGLSALKDLTTLTSLVPPNKKMRVG